MSTEFLSQHALIIAHVIVGMNLNKRRQVSNVYFKGKIIKTLTLK